jgi:alcohol dehydrogenase YqhD (iron-dependent ADH family)
VLALAGTETALAHTPDTGFLADLGHQLTSLHHLPAAVLLAVLITLLVLVTRRNRSSR